MATALVNGKAMAAGAPPALQQERAFTSDYQQLKFKLHRKLLDRINLQALMAFSEERVRTEVRAAVAQLVNEERTPLTMVEKERIIEEVLNEVFGLGPLEPLLQDPTISDILVTTPEMVYIERDGKLVETPVQFNIVPLLTSLVVALGGLALGFWLYAWRKPLEAGEHDPLSGSVVYKWMQDRFYFDELYDLVLIRPTLWLAKWTYTFIDKTVIDGFLHGVARSAVRIGEAFRVFDRVVINGGADAFANSIKELGLGFREVQTGKVQNYMLLVLLMTIIIFILFEIPLPVLR